MAYRIDFEMPLEDSLRACANDRLAHAEDQLGEHFDDDPGAAVHEARKDVKKARALLRLSRAALGDETYKRENRALRDAGRELSSVRDADVIADTVDALADRYAGRLPDRAFRALKEDTAQEPERSPADAAADARERISHALIRAGNWDLAGADRRMLRKAIRKTYARGRRAFERAERDPTDEHVHDWRKRAKDLRHQQQLLRNAWPGVVGAQAKAAKALSDLLGDDHDLAVLQQHAGDGAEAAELIAARREELQAEAFELGHRIYAESPKRFARRMDRYVREATREAATAAAA
jgi:CHAD domain-containing protein